MRSRAVGDVLPDRGGGARLVALAAAAVAVLLSGCASGAPPARSVPAHARPTHVRYTTGERMAGEPGRGMTTRRYRYEVVGTTRHGYDAWNNELVAGSRVQSCERYTTDERLVSFAGGCGHEAGLVSADDSPAVPGHGPVVPNPYFLAGWRAAGPVPFPARGGTRPGVAAAVAERLGLAARDVVARRHTTRVECLDVGLACARTASAEVTATLHVPTGFLLARVETFAGRPASRYTVRAVTFAAPRHRGAR